MAGSNNAACLTSAGTDVNESRASAASEGEIRDMNEEVTMGIRFSVIGDNAKENKGDSEVWIEHVDECVEIECFRGPESATVIMFEQFGIDAPHLIGSQSKKNIPR